MLRYSLPLLFVLVPSLSGQEGSIKEPCAVRAPCKAEITIGEGYVTGTETVEAVVRVLEIVRGEKAWEMVRAASPSNPQAGAGMEYIVARIKFAFGAKGSAGDQSYGLRDEQFASVSANGRQYERPAVVPPKPELSGRLYPGDSREGYIVLLVSIEDKNPTMSFGNNYNRVWLKLY